MKPAIFSFFSGAGFLDLGFEANGYEVCFVNENHEPFMDAYKYSREKLKMPPPKLGHHLNSIEDFILDHNLVAMRKNISLLRAEGRLVGFLGGPPCPDFSVGGKNKGRKGENGKLSGTYVDLICKTKPDFFVFENVKGLWRTKKHKEFYEHLKAKLIDNGYVLQDRLTNSIEFGVPQNRERIFLFGVKKNLFTKHNNTELRWEDNMTYPNEAAFSYLWPQQDCFLSNRTRKAPTGISENLTVMHWFAKNDVEHHPNAVHCFQPRAGLSKFKQIKEGDDSRKSYKRLHRWRYSPTACYGNNEVHLHPFLARRITVAEALAIQSMPKDFELPDKMSLSNMFKTIGNGVPFLMAQGLAQTIQTFLEKLNEKTDSRKSCARNSRIAA